MKKFIKAYSELWEKRVINSEQSNLPEHHKRAVMLAGKMVKSDLESLTLGKQEEPKRFRL